MAKLSVAIVGAGLIAGKKHIPAFLKQRNKVEIVAICDRNPELAQTMARTNGIPRTYVDLSEMLTKEKPDLVDLCTPPQTHAALAVEAMKHVAHVLIEKPMAISVQDCDAIVDASRQYKVKVCVAHSDLFYWPFMRSKELVVRGEIGEFRGMRIFLSTPTDYMTSHKDHWVHRLPGGVIGETGPHVAYMTLAFINPVLEVNVNAKKILDYPWSRFEDYRIDLMGDKFISSVTLSYASNQWIARLDIMGSTGSLMIDLEAMSLVKYQRSQLKPVPIGKSLLSESKQLAGHVLSNGVKFATGRLETTHDIIVRRFIDSISNESAVPITPEEGREAVKVTAMIVDKLKEKFG